MKFLHPKDYQNKASQIFDEVRSKLAPLLPTADIQHIGSSSIDGAISKGDLDIYIGVSRQDRLETIEKLEKHGFKIKQDTLRTEDLCMLESPEYELDVAAQIVVLGSKFEFFLKFRDTLRAEPKLVLEYNSLKESFEGRSTEDYREAKSKFIEKILSK